MAILEINSAAESEINESVFQLAAQVDNFEAYAHPHAVRIATIANEIAKNFNLAPHDRLSLRQAALVHDLGLAVMNRSYTRRGKTLSEEERLDMLRHPVIGEQEIAKRGLDRAVQLLVRWHHEWWNGEGYPDGLRREQIPLAARILRVADAYASLTDDQPHNPAVSAAQAKMQLTQWAGLEYDPRVVRAFFSLPESLAELKSFAEY